MPSRAVQGGDPWHESGTLIRPIPSGQGARRAPAEQGQSSLEFLGVLPLVFLLSSIIWQLGLWGVTASYTSGAADEAALSAGLGATSAQVREDALRSVPAWFRSNMDVTQTTTGTVKVTSKMPVIVPALTVEGLDLTSESSVVDDPG